MTAGDIRDAVSRRYADYGRDFSAGDPATAASHWHAPSLAVSPEDVLVYPTRDDRRARYAAIAEDLDATGYHRSEPVEVRTHALADGTALSNVVWHRLAEDGDLLERFSPLHLLRRTDEGWRFVARATRGSNDPMAMSGLGVDSTGTGRRDEAVRDSVAAFFEEYARAFSTAEPATAGAYWHAPTLLLSPERARVVSTRADAEAVLGTIFDGLEAEEYDRSEAAEVRVRPLDEGLALADVRWERYDAGGEAFDRFCGLHLLRETGDGWTLVAISRHPIETMLPLAAE